MGSLVLDEVVAVAASSSPAFVEAALDLYERGRVFAIVRPDTADDERLSAAKPLRVTGEASGWVTRGFTPSLSDTPAQIVFSSGTEGRPKAIVLSHRNLGSVAQRLIDVMQITSDIREYIGVPVTYSFGLGRARAVATAGGHAFIPEKFDPGQIAAMLARGEINAISAVPSLWRIALRADALLRPVGDKVRWVEIGSQYMAAEEKRALMELFPKARIVQHYGLTEASRSTFLDISAAKDDAMESVGRTDGDVEVKIADTGAIALRGDQVALGMLEGTDGAVAAITDQDGWLITKDRGDIRDGHLYFMGRLDDQMNISGVKVSADQVETGVLSDHPARAGQFAVAAVADPIRGHVALLAIEKGAAVDEAVLADAARMTLERCGVAGAEALKTMIVDSLPKTGSGKVKRTELSRAYEDRQSRTIDAPSGLRGGVRTLIDKLRGQRATSVAAVFASHFPQAAIDEQTKFEDLGGDSLSYLSVALDLEQVIGDLPDDWPGRTVEALDGAERRTGLVGRMDAVTFVRALAITLIVAGHFDVLDYGGTGAFALFFVAGMNFSALSLPAVLKSGSITPVLVLLFRVSVLTWAFITVNWVISGYGSIPAYLLITNWLSPDYPGGIWFIGLYVQLLATFCVLLTIGSVRRRMAATPFVALAGLSAAMVAILAVSEQVWDANELFRRLPHLLGWMFTCGALAHFADTMPRKAITAALFGAGWLVFSGLQLKFLVVAGFFLIFVPSVPVLRVAIPALRMTAGASLMIYLTHFQFRTITERLIGGPAVFSVVVAIVGGVAAWTIYRPFDDKVRAGVTRVFARIGALTGAGRIDRLGSPRSKP